MLLYWLTWYALEMNVSKCDVVFGQYSNCVLGDRIVHIVLAMYVYCKFFLWLV